MRTAARWTIVLGALLLVGCGGDDSAEDATTTSTPARTSTTSTATTAEPGELPGSPLRAALDSTYPTGAFDEEQFGVAPGSVTAAWYSSDDRWAVHYDGLTPDDAVGKCPGNSIQVDGGFEHVSNSPYGALACAGYENLETYEGTILPPGSLFLCNETAIVYVTEIPLSTEGTLWGSLEQVLDDGTVQGMTSMVVANAADAPEIDVSECQVVS
jgi:hypothetical protein